MKWFEFSGWKQAVTAGMDPTALRIFGVDDALAHTYVERKEFCTLAQSDVLH